MRYKKLSLEVDALKKTLQVPIDSHTRKIQQLEDILIKAGILVEVKDAPPVMADVSLSRDVWNMGPFRFFGPPTVVETKKYAVKIPNQQKDATGEPKKKGSK